MQQKTTILKSNGEMIEGLISKEEQFDILICNPPFFEGE